MSGIYSIYHIKYPHKQYIGSTCRDFNLRFSEHKKELLHGKHRKYLQHICNKHGIEGLRMVVLFSCKAHKAALRSFEQRFIDHHILVYGRENLLNGTTTSISMLDDPDVIAKTKAINSIRMKTYNQDEVFLDKVRAGIKNKRESNTQYVETRKQWAENGLNSVENRIKCEAAIRKSCSKPVYCVELDRTFEAINDAVMYLRSIGHAKASKEPISRCMRGIFKSGYGLTWIPATY